MDSLTSLKNEIDKTSAQNGAKRAPPVKGTTKMITPTIKIKKEVGSPARDADKPSSASATNNQF
jgi:hypothetical protein